MRPFRCSVQPGWPFPPKADTAKGMTAPPANYPRTALTLALGALGALAGHLLGLPVYILTGPALFITLLGLTGLRMEVATSVRDAAFLMIGISIGAGVTEEATAALLSWPLAFVALAIMLWAILAICRAALSRWFGYTRQTAILAASPGHLSYVLGLGAELNADIPRISIVQSVRVLALTLVVPFAALALGIEVEASFSGTAGIMSPLHLAALIAASILLGRIFKRISLPAPLLLGGLFASTSAHVSGLTPGGLSPWLALPAFAIMGTLIGTRFSGVTLPMLRQSLAAGILVTGIGAAAALITAWPIARLLEMPLAHVLIAFAPGGLETMIAMGVVMGANPGFVAAAHVGRLLVLTILVPLMLGRKPGTSANSTR